MTNSQQPQDLFYVEYRSGNCSMIAASSEAVARKHAQEFATSYRTRVAFVRTATQDDIEDFGGDIYRTHVEPEAEEGAGTHCQHGVPHTDTVHICL